MHTIQEHLYHVLENNQASKPDPDLPELPPPLEPNSQDTNDKPPVYQDIYELS